METVAAKIIDRLQMYFVVVIIFTKSAIIECVFHFLMHMDLQLSRTRNFEINVSRESSNIVKMKAF